MTHPTPGAQPPHPNELSARLKRFAERYPVLYASRHVAFAVFKALLPLLGLGALYAALLQTLDWPWLAEGVAAVKALLRDAAALARSLTAELGLPVFGRPEREPWFVDTQWFGWARWAVRQARWLVPIALALLVAVEEVVRRKRRQHDQYAPGPAGHDSERHD